MKIKTFMDYLKEAFQVKVNSHGEKRKKLKCPQGYAPNEAGTACIPMTAEHKHNIKIGLKQAVRTKKAEGAGAKKMQTRRTKKAMKFRARYGL